MSPAGQARETGDPGSTDPGSTDAAARRDWLAPFAVDIGLVLGVHRHGSGDPAFRAEPSGAVWRTSLTPDGPGTLRVTAGPAEPGGTPVTAGVRRAQPGWSPRELPA